MRGGVLLVASLMLGAWSAGKACAQDPPTASGTWTVAGQAVELRQARTFREADPFGRGTNPCVLVSNLPVPDEAVPVDDGAIGKLLDLMRSGEMRAFQVCFDASGTKLRNVNDVVTFHPGVSPGRFGIQGFHEFASKGGKGRIAGRLTGSGTGWNDAPWSVTVELSAPLPAE